MIVIQAAGRAEAIKKEQLSLIPLNIEYIKVQKWCEAGSDHGCWRQFRLYDTTAKT